MWIVTKTGFLSVVQHDQDPGMLRVRARRRDHLAGCVADDLVLDLGPNCPDYRWHADVDRGCFAAWISEQVYDLDYTSHVKESVAGQDGAMYNAMIGAWLAFNALQPRPLIDVLDGYESGPDAWYGMDGLPDPDWPPKQHRHSVPKRRHR